MRCTNSSTQVPTRGLLTRSLPAVSDTENTLLALSWPWRLVAPEIGYHAQKGYWSPYQPSGWRQPGSSAQRSWRAIHGDLVAPGVVLGGLLMLTLWVAYLVSLKERDQRDQLCALWLSGTLIGWGLLLIAGGAPTRITCSRSFPTTQPSSGSVLLSSGTAPNCAAPSGWRLRSV